MEYEKRWTVFDLVSKKWGESLCSKNCEHVEEATSPDYPGAILRRCALGFHQFPRYRCHYYSGPIATPEYKKDRTWMTIRLPDSSILDRLITLAKKEDRTLAWEIRKALATYLDQKGV